MTNPIFAISPLDGRYHEKLATLRPLTCEYGLMRFRLHIEVEWLIHLSQQEPITEVPILATPDIHFLRSLVTDFSAAQAEQIKAIEARTRHDVKAIEYYLKQKMSERPALATLSEFIHFACTSEDINNLAYACMLQAVREQCLLPGLLQLIEPLRGLAHHTAAASMLSRTHGQPASPTTFGKEMANFVARLTRLYTLLENTEILGKINGAVGNFNAHLIAYPECDWLQIGQSFVEQQGLTWNAYTTQIEPHDQLAYFLNLLTQINTVLIDFARDMWGYIAEGAVIQKKVEGEVGSSTMPHKINPIDFENAEGNLGLANALFTHLSQKLPISRFQRDLSDSTVLRNLGVGFGHSLIAYQALLAGLHKISVNVGALEHTLDQHWEVLAEAVQTVMRRYGVDEPYEKLKALTRGQALDVQSLHVFIDAQPLPPAVKATLKQLTPQAYVGYAALLAERV